MRNDTTVEDFKKIAVWHTIKRVKHFFKDVDHYLEAPLPSKARSLAFPRGYLKRLCRLDSTTHTKDFCKQAGFTYHGKTRSGLPPWIEVPEQVLDEVWLKRKPWSAKSNYYTKRQQKWIAKYYEALKDGVRREFDRIKKADEAMTKAREDEIRRECAEGKHCLDADYLIKQEKKQERAAMKQKVSVAKRAVKETLSDYAKLQLEVEMLRAENKRLKELVNENADIPDEAALREKLMQELTREWEQEMEDFERQQAAEASGTQMPKNTAEPMAAEKPKEISHPEDDLPSAQEIEQMQVADQAAVPQQPPTPPLPIDDIPVEEVEPKVYQHFSPERLQHFVDKLYISHGEADKIATVLKIKFSAKPHRCGFSTQDAWNHRLERKKIFTTLQTEAQPLLDDKMNKWLDVKLK